MGGDLGLDVDRAVLRVNARRYVQRRDLLAALRKPLRILADCNGVLVDDAEDRLVVVLDTCPVAQCA